MAVNAQADATASDQLTTCRPVAEVILNGDWRGCWGSHSDRVNAGDQHRPLPPIHNAGCVRQGQAMDGLTEGEIYASEQFAPDENDDITDEG